MKTDEDKLLELAAERLAFILIEQFKEVKDSEINIKKIGKNGKRN